METKENQNKDEENIVKTQEVSEVKKRSTFEASQIGAGYVRYSFEPEIFPYSEIPLENNFFFIRTDLHKEPILVKFRTMSSKKATDKIVEIYPAKKEEVIKIMRNMAMGFFFEEKLEDIRIVKTECDLKQGKVFFKFTADKRYNLSSFVPKLAKFLHVRVELKQMGTRDYAREIGGIGRCGMVVCCKTWLKEIPSVTLDMARAQYIFAPPENLTGICGRLLCCLRFELPVYQELSKNLPRIGTEIKTPRGFCKVEEVNVFKGSYKVRYDDGYEEILSKDQKW